MRIQSRLANWLFLVALLAAGLPCAAQITIGENLKLSGANGNLGTGYSGSFGNVTDSSHSLGWNGTGSIDGYYYSPSFLSFGIQPYYDQSRANSTSQSIADSSGVNFSSSIFGGSRFPGSVSYSKGYNSQGTFGVPGLANFTTHGNNDNFGVGWSANLPDLPSLSAQFQLSHSDNSIYGTDADGKSASHSFDLHSYYRLAGFSLNGGYSHSVSNSNVPLLFSNQGSATADSATDTLNFSTSHALPMRGNVAFNFTRSSSDYTYSNGQTNSGNNANDSFSTNASFQPFRKVSVSGSLSFDDNLGGEVTQAILNAGGLVQQLTPIEGSHSLSMVGAVGYQPADGLSVSGQVQRREQMWLGTTLGVTSYSGLTRWSHNVLGGALSASMSVTGSREDDVPGTVFGFSDDVSYSRELAGWNVGVGFGYSQNMQTLLVTYMTSNYNAGVNARRRLGHFYLSLGANTARTGMTIQEGAGSASESYSMGLSTGRWFGVAGSYQTSGGTAIQTTGGLTPTIIIPNPLLNPAGIITYGGRSYAFSATTAPVRRFALAASYSRSMSNTTSDTLNNHLSFEQLSITTHYQFRKMFFNGGYSQFMQGISVAGIPASKLSSFYVGVSRWFNFF